MKSVRYSRRINYFDHFHSLFTDHFNFIDFSPLFIILKFAAMWQATINFAIVTKKKSFD
jgi:hypothetical protein